MHGFIFILGYLSSFRDIEGASQKQAGTIFFSRHNHIDFTFQVVTDLAVYQTETSLQMTKEIREVCKLVRSQMAVSDRI